MKKLHILLILALSTIFVNAQGFLDDKDLAAYYPFDGNTFDVSGNNHHGTGFGITYDKGKIGQCVSIEQNGFIDIENSIVSANNTVSFWFNGYETGFYNKFILWRPTPRLYISTGHVYYTIGSDYKSGWYHCTLVSRDGNFCDVYIDGKQAWSYQPSYYQSSTGISKIISHHTKSDLDELYIFNRALSPEEIKELYHQTAPHVVYNDNRVAPFTYQDCKLSSNEPDYKIFEDQLTTNGYKYHKESHKFYAFNGNNEIIEYDLGKASSRIITKRAIKLDFNAETSSNSIGISPNGKLLACVESGGASLRIIDISSGKEIARKKLGWFNKKVANVFPLAFISDNEVLVTGTNKAMVFNITTNKGKTVSYNKKQKNTRQTVTSDGYISCDFYNYKIADGKVVDGSKELKGKITEYPYYYTCEYGNEKPKEYFNKNKQHISYNEALGDHKNFLIVDNVAITKYNPSSSSTNSKDYICFDGQCMWLEDYKILGVISKNKIAFYDNSLTENEMAKQAVAAALNANTVTAYNRYYADYKESPYLDMIKDKRIASINAVWNNLSKPNDYSDKHISELNSFIKEYPGIAITATAQKELDNIYANLLNRISSTDVPAYKQYINKYTQSPYLSSAQQKLSNAYKLNYDEVCAINKSQKYEEYAQIYPESPYAKDAQNKVKAAQQREEQERQLEEQRQKARAAEESMYKTAKLGNNKDIDKYIKTYPNGRFIAEVRQLKELANSKSWKLGNSVCNCNDDGIIMVTIDQWNEDRSAFKGIVTASPGGLYQGNLLQKGNQLWIEPDGWHKCTENEKQIALEEDKSAEASALVKNKNMPFPRGARVYRVYTSRGLLFSYSYKVVGKIDDWNDDFTKMRLQIVSTDGAEGLDGERIYEGKYIWTSPIGWRQE